MTGNRIGIEGAKAMSSMLKVNTTLTTLNLEGDEKRREEERKRKKKVQQAMRLEMKEQKQ